MISNNAYSNEAARSKGGVLKKLKKATRLHPLLPSERRSEGRKPSREVAYGFCLTKGKANHPMEDYHFCESRRIHDHKIWLFAIFDGHLSCEVPYFLQSNLFANIVAQPDFLRNPRAATLKAYKATDEAILQQTLELGTGGSTAVTAILMSDGRLVVANVGDSRAVLCRAGDAIQLSVDHEPKEEERLMIERRGGFVSTFPGDVPRVDGQLAVARAFGDARLKAHLSCEPDIHEMHVHATDEFLILASDGIWKVIDNKEAVDLIRKVSKPTVAAKMLADAAVARKSKDDISCIVVRLQ